MVAAAAAAETARPAVHGTTRGRLGLPDGRRRSGDEQHRAVDERSGDRLAGAAQDARVGLARHAHALGGGLLIEKLAIGEPDGLELIRLEGDDGEAGDGSPDGTQSPAGVVTADAAGDSRPRHVMSICS
jgi:hypothetical protein